MSPLPLRSIDLLVLGAFPPEVAPLALLLEKSASGTSPLTIEVRTAAVGVGVVAASVGASLAIGRDRPRAVLFIGSAGAFVDGGHALGAMVVPSFTCFTDGASSEGRAQIPHLVPTRLELDSGLADGLDPARVRPLGVATTPAVTIDEAVAAAIARSSGCALEHLEAFGVAYACREHQVPCAVMLGITNTVGPKGRSEWAAHHVAVADAVASNAADWIVRGAPGMPSR